MLVISGDVKGTGHADGGAGTSSDGDMSSALPPHVVQALGHAVPDRVIVVGSCAGEADGCPRDSPASRPAPACMYVHVRAEFDGAGHTTPRSPSRIRWLLTSLGHKSAAEPLVFCLTRWLGDLATTEAHGLGRTGHGLSAGAGAGAGAGSGLDQSHDRLVETVLSKVLTSSLDGGVKAEVMQVVEWAHGFLTRLPTPHQASIAMRLVARSVQSASSSTRWKDWEAPPTPALDASALAAVLDCRLYERVTPSKAAAACTCSRAQCRCEQYEQGARARVSTKALQFFECLASVYVCVPLLVQCGSCAKVLYASGTCPSQASHRV